MSRICYRSFNIALKIKEKRMDFFMEQSIDASVLNIQSDNLERFNNQMTRFALHFKIYIAMTMLRGICGVFTLFSCRFEQI